MSEVQFDNENDFQFKSRSVLGDYQKPGLVSWLQKKGIVKDDKGAQIALISITLICFSLALLVFFYDDIFTSNEVITEEEILKNLERDSDFQKLPRSEKELIKKSLIQ